MENQIMEIFLQYYRILALAGSGLIFCTLVNKRFRKMFFQTVTTILLVAGILISYALITDLSSARGLLEKNNSSLAMTQFDNFESHDPLQDRAIP